MKYSVIHSNDPYLLARMATDLQMEGWEDDTNWNSNHHPFSEDTDNYWLISFEEHPFCFHNYDGGEITRDYDKHELTESNYLQVLEAVL